MFKQENPSNTRGNTEKACVSSVCFCEEAAFITTQRRKTPATEGMEHTAGGCLVMTWPTLKNIHNNNKHKCQDQGK